MRTRQLVVAAVAALAVAACADNDTEPDTAADGEESLEDVPGADADLDEELDLEDPNDEVSDGAFRGEGVIVPALDSWSFDEFAYAQGLVLATTEDGQQQLLGQAVENDDLPEEQRVDLDELIEANLAEFPGEPAVDESVEIQGAERAHHLRFDGIPAQEEGQPDSNVLVVLAETAEGRIGVFNYAAFVDDFDEETAEAILAGVGFDPDSAPAPPQMPQEQAPEQPQ